MKLKVYLLITDNFNIFIIFKHYILCTILILVTMNVIVKSTKEFLYLTFYNTLKN